MLDMTFEKQSGIIKTVADATQEELEEIAKMTLRYINTFGYDDTAKSIDDRLDIEIRRRRLGLK